MQFVDNTVAVIILDYNKPELTSRCLSAVVTHNRVKIYLVENGYVSAEEFQAKNFIFVRNHVNSFSSGMNAGIRRAAKDGAEYFVLLNNDAIVCKYAIELLVDSLRYHNDIGLVSPNRGFSFGLIDSTNLKTCEDVKTRINQYDYTEPKLKFVPMITGFCMCTSARVLRKVGMMDEDFIFGKEDDEFSLRMIQHGFNLAEVQNSVVVHRVSSNTNFSNTKDITFLLRNTGIGRALLIRKVHSSPFKEFAGLLSDIFMVSGKSIIFYHKFSFGFVIHGLLGFGRGLLKPVHRPPQVEYSEKTPDKV